MERMNTWVDCPLIAQAGDWTWAYRPIARNANHHTIEGTATKLIKIFFPYFLHPWVTLQICKTIDVKLPDVEGQLHTKQQSSGTSDRVVWDDLVQQAWPEGHFHISYVPRGSAYFFCPNSVFFSLEDSNSFQKTEENMFFILVFNQIQGS